MFNHPHTASRFSRLRILWKPAVATSTGGRTLTLWFEEIIAFAKKFIGVLLLPVLAVLIYLLDIFIFKAAMPKAEGIKKK